MRHTLGLDATQAMGRADARWNMRRGRRVPSTDWATPGYKIVNLSLTRQFTGDARGPHVPEGDEPGDRLAYNAASIDTIRGLAPLPGRAIKAGVRVNF